MLKLLARTLQLGVKNLWLHKLRSLLTLLGVILGVASVISMLAITEGSKREALDQIRKLGASNVILRSVKPRQRRTMGEGSTMLEFGLTYSDYDRLGGALPTLTKRIPGAMRRLDVQHGVREIKNAKVLGTTPDYPSIKQQRLLRGRFLTANDHDAIRNVAVLGSGAARRLFGFADPIDRFIAVGVKVYQVIGVMRGSSSSADGEDYDSLIYIPLSAARYRIGNVQVIRRSGSSESFRNELSEITLVVKAGHLVRPTARMARQLLKREHPDEDDFEIQVPVQLLEQAEEEKRIWNIVLGSVAGISLVVGGIGIMNIMLASVTERTREIGIRRALGATQFHITLQFLVETIVLSTTGGLLGISAGLLLPWIITTSAGLPVAIQVWPLLVAFGISVGVGMLFGIYPAWRAAQLDPIEALRHD